MCGSFCHSYPMDRHLSIDEKRDWLAAVFRDESGECSRADKLKAMVEDTKLAQLAEENRRAEEEQRAAAGAAEARSELRWDLLAHLPPPCEP